MHEHPRAITATCRIGAPTARRGICRNPSTLAARARPSRLRRRARRAGPFCVERAGWRNRLWRWEGLGRRYGLGRRHGFRGWDRFWRRGRLRRYGDRRVHMAIVGSVPPADPGPKVMPVAPPATGCRRGGAGVVPCRGGIRRPCLDHRADRPDGPRLPGARPPAPGRRRSPRRAGAGEGVRAFRGPPRGVKRPAHLGSGRLRGGRQGSPRGGPRAVPPRSGRGRRAACPGGGGDQRGPASPGRGPGPASAGRRTFLPANTVSPSSSSAWPRSTTRCARWRPPPWPTAPGPASGCSW